MRRAVRRKHMGFKSWLYCFAAACLLSASVSLLGEGGAREKLTPVLKSGTGLGKPSGPGINEIVTKCWSLLL